MKSVIRVIGVILMLAACVIYALTNCETLGQVILFLILLFVGFGCIIICFDWTKRQSNSITE